MIIDPSQVFADLINPPLPRHKIETGLSMEEYRTAPGFNPSTVKKGAPEIKDGGTRGHVSRMLSYLHAQQEMAAGRPAPAGYRDTVKRAGHFALGSAYHHYLFEPDTFDQFFATITPEIQESLVELAKERKMNSDKFPTEFSNRHKEAVQFKKDHGRKPNESEQPALLKSAQDRFMEGISFHPRLTELGEWVTEQQESGKEILTVEEREKAIEMASAIHELPANRDVAAYIESQRPLDSARCEVSMFAHLEWARGGSVQLKGRADLVTTGAAFLDPKSCQSAHPWDFANTVSKLGYDIQAGAYTLMSELLADTPEGKAMGFPKSDFGFLAQESSPPFLAKLYWLPPEWIKYGRTRFLAVIRQACRALDQDDWSGEGDDYVFASEPDTEFPGEMLTPPDRLMPILEQL